MKQNARNLSQTFQIQMPLANQESLVEITAYTALKEQLRCAILIFKSPNPCFPKTRHI